ncbi:hypothetical protein SDC9_161570 [bioreactor metagenome]|uniref:Sialate O-acetylesterase domain-containing protein n=1 Tax=bioreactor metagenome TaxID=1076179 RepID=A0A645FPS8_9ZZZZ
MLREAQLRNLKTIPNSGMAVTMDIGEELCIHPSRKQEVGERLAYLALSKTYKLDGYKCRTPIYKSMKIEGGKAYLSFNDCDMNVAPLNVPLSDFEIAGEDKVFYPANAVIQKGTGLTVSAPEVPNPIAVRYGFKNWVKGSLFDTSGLPVSSFRTDNW